MRKDSQSLHDHSMKSSESKLNFEYNIPKESVKMQSLHLSGSKENRYSKKAGKKNQPEDKNAGMGASLKRNHRNFDLNRYIQDAKREIKQMQ